MVTVGTVCAGKVVWFDSEKGFGFIAYPEGDGKDIFVHFSAILTSGYKTLRDGDEVEFTITESNNKLQAGQVTVTSRRSGYNGSSNDRQPGKDQKHKK